LAIMLVAQMAGSGITVSMAKPQRLSLESALFNFDSLYLMNPEKSWNPVTSNRSSHIVSYLKEAEDMRGRQKKNVCGCFLK